MQTAALLQFGPVGVQIPSVPNQHPKFSRHRCCCAKCSFQNFGHFFKEKQTLEELAETSPMGLTQQPQECPSHLVSPSDLYSVILYCAVLYPPVADRSDNAQAEATPLPK